MKALATPLSRPIGTGAVYAAILLVGLAALRGLPLGLTPDTDLPRLTVNLFWPSSTPHEMEALVTSRVESEVQTLRGVEEVSSISGAGWAAVDAAFHRGADLNLLEVLLRDRLAAIRDELPPALAPPSFERSLPRGVDSGNFLILQVSGPYTAESLRELLEDGVIPRLLSVPGVAGAEIYGGTTPEIRIDVDRDGIARGLVEPERLQAALERIGGTRSLGAVHRDGARVPVVLERAPADADAVGRSWIGRRGNLPLHLADVSRVTNTWAEPRRISRLNGQPSLQIVLERERGTNVIDVASRVLATCDALTSELPAGVGIETIYDQSELIRGELRVLTGRAGLSVLCILAVLLLFQRRLRAPIVVLGSVVFSALATFLLFRLSGLGMNLVTLSGLALAFGMAVDNSIVILENISLRVRGRSRTMVEQPGPASERRSSTPRSADRTRMDRLRTLAATREVLFPLLAATLTTAVVLMPFLYLSGDLREYYLPFALAVCLSLLASMGVALTLTPLLARWGLAGRRIARDVRPSRLLPAYGHVLDRLLRRPLVPAIVAALLLAGSLWIFDSKVSRGSIFPPNTDTTLRVSIEFPPGAEIAQTDALISSFEKIALEHPFRAKGYIQQIETFVRERSAFLSVRFHPAVARSTVPAILKDRMTFQAAATSGVTVSVFGQGPGYSVGGASVSPSYRLILRGPDYLQLAGLTDDLARRLQRNGRIKNVDANLSGMLPKDAVELALVPDRDRMGRMGVTMPELVAAVEPAIASELASRRLRDERGEIEARIRSQNGDALTPGALERTLMRSGTLPPFPLGTLISIDERPIQAEIRRHEQRYERQIGFEYRGPRKIGNRFVKSIVENTSLPSGYSLTESEGLFLSRKDERQILLALGFAIVLVYMVSAALFESVMLPFVAILSVPLSFVGIAAIFWAMDEPFDRTAYVGLILLAGIAINNALLFVHRAGALRRRTGDAVRAARQAAFERIRPILMTTATSVAGLLPLAWDVDPTAVAGWRSLALAGTGGLLASALFTLTIIPVLFVLLSRNRGRQPSSDVNGTYEPNDPNRLNRMDELNETNERSRS